MLVDWLDKNSLGKQFLSFSQGSVCDLHVAKRGLDVLVAQHRLDGRCGHSGFCQDRGATRTQAMGGPASPQASILGRRFDRVHGERFTADVVVGADIGLFADLLVAVVVSVLEEDMGRTGVAVNLPVVGAVLVPGTDHGDEVGMDGHPICLSPLGFARDVDREVAVEPLPLHGDDLADPQAEVKHDPNGQMDLGIRADCIKRPEERHGLTTGHRLDGTLLGLGDDDLGGQ